MTCIGCTCKDCRERFELHSRVVKMSFKHTRSLYSRVETKNDKIKELEEELEKAYQKIDKLELDLRYPSTSTN